MNQMYHIQFLAHVIGIYTTAGASIGMLCCKLKAFEKLHPALIHRLGIRFVQLVVVFDHSRIGVGKVGVLVHVQLVEKIDGKITKPFTLI